MLSSTFSHAILRSNPPFGPYPSVNTQAVKSMECLEIMGKLMYNCAVSPREEKFRRIKLTNKRLAETLGSHPGNDTFSSCIAMGRWFGEGVRV